MKKSIGNGSHKKQYDVTNVIGLVVRGDIRQVRALLNSQPELADAKEETSFNTPLHVASSRGKFLYCTQFIIHIYIKCCFPQRNSGISNLLTCYFNLYPRAQDSCQ